MAPHARTRSRHPLTARQAGTTHGTRAFCEMRKKGGGFVKCAGHSEKHLRAVQIQWHFSRVVCQCNLITRSCVRLLPALCSQQVWRGFSNPPADKLQQSPVIPSAVPRRLGKTQSDNPRVIFADGCSPCDARAALAILAFLPSFVAALFPRSWHTGRVQRTRTLSWTGYTRNNRVPR